MSGIFETNEGEFDSLVRVWEAAVRATHDFLSEEDIAWLRPRIRHDYLAAVDLRVFKGDDGAVLGFVGVAQDKVEMLFIAPEVRGRGIGRRLLHCAVAHLGATAVDVNEQNPQAIGFYLHEGFEIAGRSPVDGQGKPFPLLHLRLAAPTDAVR